MVRYSTFPALAGLGTVLVSKDVDMSETWLLLVFEAPDLAPWIRILILIRIEIKSWIRIRIETNADPQHWFSLILTYCAGCVWCSNGYCQDASLILGTENIDLLSPLIALGRRD
jgi:hypothetical protein